MDVHPPKNGINRYLVSQKSQNGSPSIPSNPSSTFTLVLFISSTWGLRKPSAVLPKGWTAASEPRQGFQQTQGVTDPLWVHAKITPASWMLFYIYMCIYCMYIYIYMYIYMYIYIYILLYVYMYILLYVYIYVYVYMYMYIYMYIYM